jgi:uncharacterized Zn-finger protein
MSQKMSQKFTCPKCSNTFTSKQNLNIHIQTICEKDPSLKFTCTYCENDFSRQNALTTHYKTCSKKKEYELMQTNDIVLKELEDSKKLIIQKDQKIKDLENELSKKDKLIIYLKGRLNIEQDSFY